MRYVCCAVLFFACIVGHGIITEAEVQASEELAVKQLHSNEVAAANRIYRDLTILKVGMWSFGLTSMGFLIRKDIVTICKGY